MCYTQNFKKNPKMFGNLFSQDDEEEEDSCMVLKESKASLLGPCPVASKERPKCGFVGLRNQGATCYMNSLIQAHYAIPEFRSKILALNTSMLMKGEDGKKRRLPLALQRLFCEMRALNRDCISTEDFTSEAFGWTSDEVSRQQDVHELNRYLLEWLESQLRSTSARDMIRNLFKGEEETMMEVNGKIVSKRSQNFLDIALPVEGQRDLVQGLFKVFEPSLLDGSNQYRYEGKLVDAVRRTRICNLPPVMIFSLLRYKYDLRTYDRIRINDKYPFPLVLDMRTVMYQEQESSSSASTSASRWESLKSEHKSRLRNAHHGMIWLEDVLKSKESEREMRARSRDMGSSDPLIYDLCAVIVQSGSVRSGHYHALVRDVAGNGVWSCDDGDNTENLKTKKKKKKDEKTVSSTKEVKKNVRLQDGALAVLRDVISRCKVPPKLQSVGSLLKKRYGKSWSQVFRDRHGSLIRYLKTQSKHFRIVKDCVSVKKQVEKNTTTNSAKNEWTTVRSEKKSDNEWTTVKSKKKSDNEWTTVKSKKKSDNEWTTVTSSRSKKAWTTVASSRRNETTSSHRADIQAPSERILSENWGKWFDFNDSSVHPISLRRVQDQFGGKDSAYMLVYRSRKLSKRSTVSCLPKYWQERIQEENKSLEKKRQACEDYKNKIVVIVRTASYFTLDVASRNSLLIPRKYKKNQMVSKKQSDIQTKEPTKWNVVGKQNEREISKRVEILRLEKKEEATTTKATTTIMEAVFAIDRRDTMDDLMNQARENLKNSSKNIHFSLTKRCGEESFAIVSKSFRDEKTMKVSELISLAESKDISIENDVLEMIAWNGKSIENCEIQIGGIGMKGRLFRLQITRAYEDPTKNSETFEVVIPEQHTLSQLREAILNGCEEVKTEEDKNIEMYLLEKKNALKHLAENFYKRDKSLEVWGIKTNSEIFVQNVSRSRKKGKKNPVERELLRRNRTVLVEICDRREKSSSETMNLKIDHSSTFGYVIYTPEMKFSNKK